MAIITLARMVAARGDEIGSLLAEKLNYKFIKRTDIEKRIVELGFPESKMPTYDERKPGFIASIAKSRDEYFNYSKIAMLQAAQEENVIIIGRGSFALFNDMENSVSVRLVADDKVRLERLMKEFDWNEKQARQRITESDANRDGFHKNFYNVDVAKPENYHMVLNSGLLSDETCANIIAGYVTNNITADKEEIGKQQIENALKAQSVINKILFEYKIKIEFAHAKYENNNFTLYGVANSQAIAEQALRIAQQEIPGCETVSAVSIIQSFKSYQ